MRTSSSNLFKRGSEWRKWDLHVHSPSTYGGKYDDFIKNLNSAEAEVIGINDYCTIEGYEQVLSCAGMKLQKPIFPVVEFRMNNLILDKNDPRLKSGARINFHIIFDNDEKLTTRIKTWLNTLDCNYEGGKLDSLGNINISADALKITFDYLRVIKSLEQDEHLKKRYLVWLPYSEYGGIDKINPDNDGYFKLGMINKADIIGSANKKQIDFFVWKNSKHPESAIKKWLNGRKLPCIKGSDAHLINYPFGRLQDRDSKPVELYCWIKADPTFEGLRRVISEPEERVHIGAHPSKLQDVSHNPSKYIRSIGLGAITQGTTPAWFDNDDIELNTGLIAIIGKKGSGKSALADILALLGRTHIDPKDYSFLKKDRFRKGVIATRYKGTINWSDNKNLTDHCLNNDVDSDTELERVRYLPQVYVDRLCNEVGVSDKFQKEINKVVFSYLLQNEKQGVSTLPELIAKRTSAIDAELSTLREQLNRLIGQNTVLEDKKQPSYKTLVNNKLKDIQMEHDAIVAPKKIKKPSSEPDKKTRELIDSLKRDSAKIEKDISEAEAQLASVTKRQTSIENIRGHLKNLSLQVNIFHDHISSDLSALDIVLDDILIFDVKKEKLTSLETATKQEIHSLNAKLGRVKSDKQEQEYESPEAGDKSNSIDLTKKKLHVKKALDDITHKLSTEQKAYEEYLKLVAEVEKRKKALAGTDDDTSLSTILSLKSELQYIERRLDADIESKQTQITETKNKIFDVIASKCDTYKSIYKPLRDFVEQEKDAQEQAESILTFDVGIVCNKERFVQKFLRFIDQGRLGSFQYVTTGRERIVTMLQQRSFRTKDSVNKFLEELVNALKFNRSNDDNEAVEIDDQLVKNVSKNDLMEWLYGLEYLDVQYKVQFNGKDLNAAEFSPGERGAILLIFYLLIDRENIPLIIDQPEENLDNESVFNLLVPYIKRAKKHRQVVIVTHNPNLAVACDAEQIICASMDKTSNEIRYKSGSIEHPEINQRIIDVLEGTMPAFRTRDSAYQEKGE